MEGGRRVGEEGLSVVGATWSVTSVVGGLDRNLAGFGGGLGRYGPSFFACRPSDNVAAVEVVVGGGIFDESVAFGGGAEEGDGGGDKVSGARFLSIKSLMLLVLLVLGIMALLLLLPLSVDCCKGVAVKPGAEEECWWCF